MFVDWSIIGSVVSLGIIGMVAYSAEKPKTQLDFSRRIKYIHIRSLKKINR